MIGPVTSHTSDKINYKLFYVSIFEDLGSTRSMISELLYCKQLRYFFKWIPMDYPDILVFCILFFEGN